MNATISPHAKATLEEYAKVRAEVLKRFEAEEKQKGFLRRLSRWWKIEREVKKEMKRRFPPGALYSQ
ncbi:MAG: hypothetical protein HYX71_03515 [Opitutae bacterium]|nr:hypothetical protein [Opitutae bacterium]